MNLNHFVYTLKLLLTWLIDQMCKRPFSVSADIEG